MTHHVLMTADAVGGVWTYALDLARALATGGGRVTLAVMGPPPAPAQRAAAAAVPGLDLHERPYALEWMPDPWRDVREAGEWLLDLAARVRPDVVHVNGYCHGALPWRAPAIVVAHSCVLSWWRAVHGTPAPAAWSRYAAEAARGVRAAAFVAAPTAAMLAAAEAHYGPLPPARVIPNGRAATPGACAPKEPFVLSAGRLWDEAKNMAALSAAAPRIAWPVYVAGDAAGPDGPAPIDDRRVRHLGRLEAPALRAWMARAAIYALPARYEPFGLSALEAALEGCALVLGDIPSLREVWGDAASYCAPGDPADLAAAVTRLIEDADLRARLADRAGRRARRLTPERMARAYAEVYTGLRRARCRE